jgi:hypothetical protein
MCSVAAPGPQPTPLRESCDRAASFLPRAAGLGMAVLLRGTSAAATTGPSSTLLATTFRRARGCGRLLSVAPRHRRVFAARASAQPLEVCAKESITVPGRLGDCELSLLSLFVSLFVHARGSM